MTKIKLIGFAGLLGGIGFFALNSTLSVGDTRPAIQLSDIEGIHFGKDTSVQAVSAIGQPDKVVTSKNGTKVWIYNDRVGQKASLVIDPKTDVIQTGLWLPSASHDPWSKLNSVLSHFKTAKFSIKDVGWIVDYYSDEARYVDSARGISLTVFKSSKTVSAIGFSSTQSSASLAKHN